MRRKERRPILWVALLLGLLAAGCRSREENARLRTGGEPDRGPALIQRYGCSRCHTIPGVPGADGTIGPPLDRIESRPYLAGRLPNTPENLLRWIRDPQSVSSGTAMPQLGVAEQDGRDIAAYLYTLR
ncbi:MAG: c-type cytochrome [Acidobacteriota bacterium]